MRIRMSSDVVYAGTYSARYIGTEVTQAKRTKHLFMEFEISAGKNQGRRVKAWIASTDDGHFSFPPGSRSHKWVECLRGRPISLEEDINLESFKGARCKIEIENKQKDDKVFANLIKVLPA